MEQSKIFRLLMLVISIIALFIVIGYVYAVEAKPEKSRNEEIENIVDNMESEGSKLVELSDGSYLIIWDK